MEDIVPENGNRFTARYLSFSAGDRLLRRTDHRQHSKTNLQAIGCTQTKEAVRSRQSRYHLHEHVLNAEAVLVLGVVCQQKLEGIAE